MIAFYEQNRSFIESHGRFKQPLLITGFPRTGTTLLQQLMSEDPNSRAAYRYEIESPIPPRKTGEDPFADPRIEKSAAFLKTAKTLLPGYIEKVSESHLISPTIYEESFSLMMMHCGLDITTACDAGKNYLNALNIPENLRAVFRYEQRFFTMLMPIVLRQNTGH